MNILHNNILAIEASVTKSVAFKNLAIKAVSDNNKNVTYEFENNVWAFLHSRL
jgi:hypothetical protein